MVVGITGEMTTFSPFRLAGDFNYGSVDMGTVRSLSGYDGATSKTIDLKRSGWLASAIAEYKLDFGVPGLLLWYGSGDNSNPYDAPNVCPPWTPAGPVLPSALTAVTAFPAIPSSAPARGHVGRRAPHEGHLLHGKPDSRHSGRYYRGTNNKNMPANAGMTTFHASYPDATGSMVGSTYLTTKDGAWKPLRHRSTRSTRI